ncbi:MAG: diphosphate--fructose-6-phosphate 1-phosphotransferase [Spirochaetaceae bacterium]|nr:MAG: diphosphate--fructose-6-phosphate 1-phosphotransferase [Spirochaetaceae bacterium]
MSTHSPLQVARYAYVPRLPPVLRRPIGTVVARLGDPTEAASDREGLKQLFPHTYGAPIAGLVEGTNEQCGAERTVGVVLSGGQAPGGHNVISGLFDGLKAANPQSTLLGFLGGPSGITNNKAIEITESLLAEYRNTGGFDVIGSGRTKIETDEQFEAVAATCEKRNIDAIVVIGGDDSNTNAAVLAEYFLAHNMRTQVVGVPKTIDGDLKNDYIETSFGFDTATKTYSELIGNIERDANSARKYWHFIKLMGRSASHIALECALQTQPNICLVSEEVAAKRQTLDQVVAEICEVVAKRAEAGNNFGVALIPEGLIEFIPEMGRLISCINDILAKNADAFGALSDAEAQREFVGTRLDTDSAHVFGLLPKGIQAQLLVDRDPHGNVQVSRIETEKLLMEMVEQKLAVKREEGAYKGKFSALSHFFGYEGRCAFPSNFDADYCYSLGYTACVLIANGLTGYIAAVRNLAQPSEQWTAAGIPITMMMNMEQRHGSRKPVIRKALVELDAAPFKAFAAERETWALTASYVFPGAIQYFGPDEVCNQPTQTLKLEHHR